MIKEILSKLKFAEIFCIYLTTLCMVFFFYIMDKSFSIKTDLPSEVDQIMICVIGILGSVVGYVVGSSKGSADKDKMIVDAAKSSKTNTTQQEEITK